jgi:hypothetical protein
VAGVLAFAAVYHWQATNAAYEAGKTSAISRIEKDNEDARKRSETELRRLDRGDRSGVSGFDRD